MQRNTLLIAAIWFKYSWLLTQLKTKNTENPNILSIATNCRTWQKYV